MSRRSFSSEYKVEVASKVLDDGMTVPQASEAFGVGPTAIRNWVRLLEQERAGGVTRGAKPITPEQQRIRELEAQVRRLEEEKSILKKATAFFVQEQTGKQWF